MLVSAGFDAAAGHPAPLGGYAVSAACFAHMTKALSTLARGKVRPEGRGTLARSVRGVVRGLSLSGKVIECKIGNEVGRGLGLILVRSTMI